MLLPLALPPGVMANGTELQAAGRWRDASLVRWLNGTMRPVGGWEAWHDTTLTEAPRGALAWRDNSGDRRLVLATYDTVVSVAEGGTATDITPAGLVAGDLDATVSTGYGSGTYGSGTYGTPAPDSGAYSEVTTWALDTWGEELIACSSSDGTLWHWDLNPANNLVALTGAPTSCLSVIVTEERFVMALGAGGDPRKAQWCDREDYTTWTPATTNEAGSLTLQIQGQMMCGARVAGGTLILTTEGAHVAVYQGPPFVYGFTRVGSACGPVARKAVAAVDGKAFWMGQGSFFAYAGGEVATIPCEVSDLVFGNLNVTQLSKAWAVANGQFSEVWFFYPSGDSNECDRYAVFNYRENHWTVGALARTCGVDRGVFSQPLWAGSDGTAYSHETGVNHDDAPVYAESGPVQLGDGEAVMTAVQVIPDELVQGDVTLTFRSRLYPNGTESTHGPYTLANPTSVRFTGRQFVMRVDEARMASWRVGAMRLKVRPRGER